jgi:hypothetical protein
LSSLADAELRRLAACSAALLRIAAARGYGLVSGGPEIDEDRCEDVLALVAERGLEVSQSDVDDATAQLMLEMMLDEAAAR